MEKRDYYEVLGVARDADPAALKSAYRKLAHQYHPDKNQGDTASEDRFKELTEAYAVLSDDEKRARYDRFGHAGGGGSSSDPFGFGMGAASINDIFGDIFGEVFGGGGRRTRQRARGEDYRYHLELTLEEAAFGVTKRLRIPRPKPCILGSGGGLAIRAGYRNPGPWYIGGAYEFTKMDSSNLYRLGIFQQLRFEMRYLLDTGYRASPYLT